MTILYIIFIIINFLRKIVKNGCKRIPILSNDEHSGFTHLRVREVLVMNDLSVS